MWQVQPHDAVVRLQQRVVDLQGVGAGAMGAEEGCVGDTRNLNPKPAGQRSCQLFRSPWLVWLLAETTSPEPTARLAGEPECGCTLTPQAAGSSPNSERARASHSFSICRWMADEDSCGRRLVLAAC